MYTCVSVSSVGEPSSRPESCSVSVMQESDVWVSRHAVKCLVKPGIWFMSFWYSSVVTILESLSEQLLLSGQLKFVCQVCKLLWFYVFLCLENMIFPVLVRVMPTPALLVTHILLSALQKSKPYVRTYCLNYQENIKDKRTCSINKIYLRDMFFLLCLLTCHSSVFVLFWAACFAVGVGYYCPQLVFKWRTCLLFHKLYRSALPAYCLWI